ncbi:hypothetical protein EVAR_99728_1 [Eumeta japonica]|uniref:Uncharacterized protein n=1 Tax=Eumeta variegata TaxID=151549 RepID=A0A4C1Z8G0_EUMVA|nr:hypothetical protein EVAR_99728_1 [Eumeta japonica]
MSLVFMLHVPCENRWTSGRLTLRSASEIKLSRALLGFELLLVMQHQVTTSYSWFVEFKSYRINRSDEFRDGRPATAVNKKDIDVVRHMIETDRRADGVIRVADIETKNGVVRKAYNIICSLLTVSVIDLLGDVATFDLLNRGNSPLPYARNSVCFYPHCCLLYIERGRNRKSLIILCVVTIINVIIVNRKSILRVQCKTSADAQSCSKPRRPPRVKTSYRRVTSWWEKWDDGEGVGQENLTATSIEDIENLVSVTSIIDIRELALFVNKLNAPANHTKKFQF